MRSLKWVILGLVVVGMLGLTNSASAQCTAKLTSGIGPIGQTYQPGDTVPYRVTLSVPDDADACTLVNLTVYYFPPPLGIDAIGGYATPCEAVADGYGTVIGTIPVMNPGDPEEQWDIPYVVTAADLVAGSIKGEMAVTFFAQGSDIERCDQKTGENFVECPEPCVEITKTVDCDISKVGDEVVYTICLLNCGEAELTGIEVTDPHLGGVLGGFPSTLPVGGDVCVDFPYTIQPGDEPGPVENQATVTVDNPCDPGGAPMMAESEIVIVNLIHPAMEVTKTCLTDPVPEGQDAEFEVTIENTGDVPLNYTTDEPAIGPGSLNPGEVLTQTVTKPVPAGVQEVCNEITVTWTIGGDNPCELDNTGDIVAGDCCPVPGGNGCTPGFWKNHPDCWCERFDPGDLLGDVFVIPAELSYHSGHTLMDALNYTGGRMKGDRRDDVNDLEAAAGRLLFHAVAGVLNGCHPDVPYPQSADGVITAVNAALATLDIGEFSILHGLLEEWNELGCSIDAHCRPHPEIDME